MTDSNVEIALISKQALLENLHPIQKEFADMSFAPERVGQIGLIDSLIMNLNSIEGPIITHQQWSDTFTYLKEYYGAEENALPAETTPEAKEAFDALGKRIGEAYGAASQQAIKRPAAQPHLVNPDASPVTVLFAPKEALLNNLQLIVDIVAQNPNPIIAIRNTALLHVIMATVESLNETHVAKAIWDSTLKTSFERHEGDKNTLCRANEDEAGLAVLKDAINTAYLAAAMPNAPGTHCSDAQHSELLCESRAEALER